MLTRPGDHGERGDRVRTPVKGLRQRLRIALKSAGVTAKFRTDHLRDDSLIVKSTEFLGQPLASFEGHHIRYTKTPS